MILKANKKILKCGYFIAVYVNVFNFIDWIEENVWDDGI